MVNREPKRGDFVLVNGAMAQVVYVSVNGIDVESLDGEYLRTYEPDEYDQVVYADKQGNVEHPQHYAHPSGIEVIDIVKHESFLRGNILKYVLRSPYKGHELEDMQKAKQYLDWEIERLQQTPSN